MSSTETDGAIEVIRDRALFVREETVRLISIAKTGHYASAFSAAEIIATLYYGVMRLRRGEPDWPDRDRFLMGKGHAAVGRGAAFAQQAEENGRHVGYALACRRPKKVGVAARPFPAS